MVSKEKIGVGILSWRGGASFEAALKTYQAAQLFDHFDEKLIWFQEMSAADQVRAKSYDVPCTGSPDNQGILGGFKNLAQSMTSEVLVLLENDLPLIEPSSEVTRQLEMAFQAVRSGEVQVFRLRHVTRPGQKFDTISKYIRYHQRGVLPGLRRSLRPGKAHRLSGTALYVEDDPGQKFPETIQKTSQGYLKIKAATLPWTNQSIMVRRDFFLDTIIAHAERHPSPRRVNGFPDIEKEWNSRRWRNSGWWIGADKGLFTHQRTSGECFTPEAGPDKTCG